MAINLLGMGNPLLDISSEVEPAMVEKYGLKMGDAVLAEEKHQPLFDEMVKLPSVQYIAGGATQNSIRVAQWMLQSSGATAYMGCIGNDANGNKMKEACAADGVKTAYMIDSSTPTGCCAVLINHPERSLCTNLNAANNFKVEHLKQPENWAICEAAKVIYSAGFFITVCPDAMRAACAEAAKHDGLYCLNLSAPFLMMVPPFKAVFVELMPQVDFLFGNETEAQTWADSGNSGHSKTYKIEPIGGENMAGGGGSFQCGPYYGPYNHHCAVKAWHDEWDLWNVVRRWAQGAVLSSDRAAGETNRNFPRCGVELCRPQPRRNCVLVFVPDGCQLPR